MTRISVLLALGGLVLLLGAACGPGTTDDSAYGPSYYYDSAHKVSCYTSDGIFCFQGLPNGSKPGKWEALEK